MFGKQVAALILLILTHLLTGWFHNSLVSVMSIEAKQIISLRPIHFNWLVGFDQWNLLFRKDP